MADESIVEQLYQEFIPIQTATIAQRSILIPGTKITFDYLIARDTKVGANTCYSQWMITKMCKRVAEQGYSLASIVCATDVPKGRPYLRQQAYQRFYHVGAHFVIDSVADLPTIIEEI